MEKPRRRKKQLPPFFDHLDNPELHHFPRGEEVDGTPPPPHLALFDRGVLKVCGTIGSRVYAADFQALLSAYPQVLKRIQAFKTQKQANTVCTFPVVDADSGQKYPAVFVKKDDAIVTCYPDATPTDPYC